MSRTRRSRVKEPDPVERLDLYFSRYPNNTLPDDAGTDSVDISTYPGLADDEDQISIINGTATQVTFLNDDYVDTDPGTTKTTGWRSGIVWETDWDASDGFVVHAWTNPNDADLQSGGPLVCFKHDDDTNGIGAWAVRVLTWFELGDLGRVYTMFKYRDTCFVDFADYMPNGEGCWLSLWVKGTVCWLTVTSPTVNNLRVAGPVEIDADLLTSKLQGLQLDVGWRDASTQQPAVEGVINRCIIRPYNGPDPIDYDPATITVGTFTKSTSALAVAVPDNSQTTDRLLLAVAGNVTPTVTSHWTLLDNGSTTGHNQRIYYHDVTRNSPFYNSTSATTAVTHTAGACAGVVIRIRNYNPRVPILYSRVLDSTSDTASTISSQAVYGEHRASIAIISCPANNTLTFPAGWTVTQTSGAQAVTLGVGVVADWSSPSGGLALEESPAAGLPMQVPTQNVTWSPNAAVSVSHHLVILPDPTLISAW